MRFDKFVAEQNAIPTTNGHSEPVKSVETDQHVSPPDSKVAQKRKSTSDDESELSNVPVTPPPKKKRKPEPALDDDAAFAAKLQAEENSRARPTRGGANRKNTITKKKKKKTPKKKTADRVKAEDDSELEGSGSEDKKVNRSGGFHVSVPLLSLPIMVYSTILTEQKPLVLSAPLSALLDGEIQVRCIPLYSSSCRTNRVQLSRPQTVKRIWQYVRERDLQDPKDKRQIRCDEAMRAVFKQDKVHMFTMNKILNQNLYNPEE